MPTLHDFDLPEELRAELETLALKIDGNEAVLIARSLPKQFKGFEVSKKKADQLRSRLSRCIWSLKELDPTLQQALAGASLGRSLIAVLSAEALRHGLDGWLGCFGREGMLLGMLLDEREEVRDIAQGVLAGMTPTIHLSEEEALQALAEDFDPFLEKIARFMPGAAAAPEPDPELQQKCDQLRTSLVEAERRVRTLEKHLAERDEQLEHQKGETQRLKGLNKDARSREDAAVKRSGELAAEIVRLEEGRSAAIATGVAAALAERRNLWLTGPESVEEALAQIDRDADGLLAVARQALHKQHEYDRHSGNRARLQEHLAKLEEVLSRLQEARANSIRLHPCIEEALAAVKAKISEVSQVLGRDRSDDPALAVLAAKINVADCIGTVADLLRLAAEMHGCGLLATEAHEVIRAAAERKLWLLLAIPGNKGQGLQDLGCLASTEPGQSCRVVVDGHNLLFSYPYFRHYFDGSNPGKKARVLLAEAVNCLVQSHPGLYVDLFFDSREINDQSFSDRVRLIFSGGDQAEHRADDAILAHLEYLRLNDVSTSRLLVTCDRELADAAATGGTKVVSTEEFAVLLPLGQSDRQQAGQKVIRA